MNTELAISCLKRELATAIVLEIVKSHSCLNQGFINHLAKKKNNRSNSNQTQRQRAKKRKLKIVNAADIDFNMKKINQLNKQSQPVPIYTPKKEIKQGHSNWFPGGTRPNWTRPCFKDFQYVIIGDSQLKIYGQQNKEKKGFSITSFSGCDVSFL